MESDLEADLDYTLGATPSFATLRRTSVFITGGTGFVGTWLVRSFLQANVRADLQAEITILTRDTRAYRERMPDVALNPSVRLLSGDVCSFDPPDQCFPFVIHAATERHKRGDSPLHTFERDVTATRRVLEFARTHGTRRLLFTSSGAVYNQTPENERVSEEDPGAPSTTDTDSAYAQGKRVSEWYCAMYGRTFAFTVTIARLFAFVGPYLPLDANYAVGNFIRDALAGGPIRVKGDGTPYRSYMYAADLAVWLWTILLAGSPGRVYNVGSPEAISIAELAGTVAALLAPGARVEIAKEPALGDRPPRYVPNVQRAASELRLCHMVGLREGIRRTAAWHRRSLTT